MTEIGDRVSEIGLSTADSGILGGMATFQITVDCRDPDVLARFWATALPGYQLQPPPEPHESWRDYWRSVGVPEDELGDGHDSIVSTDGSGPRVWFQVVPESKTIKNRLHFDLMVGGGRSLPRAERRRRVEAEVARLQAVGATLIEVGEYPDVDHVFARMLDPEGNEFDIA